MYYFSIPDSSKTRVGNMEMLHLMREHSEWFYDDFKIDVAYGCPPSCIWNGGRAENGDRYSQLEFASVINFFKNHGVKYRLNFTNQCLKEEHLSDGYGNAIAEVVNDFGGEVAATLSLMTDYMANKYFNLNIVWSTSTDYGQSVDERIERINQLLKKYKVVLPYNFNNTADLDKFECPGNIEILVCDSCMDNCPRRREHQNLISQAIRKCDFNFAYNDCIAKREHQSETLILEQGRTIKASYRNIVSRNMLPFYGKIGINKFKISGRTNLASSMAAYIHFFIQPQYYENTINEWEQGLRQINAELNVQRGNLFFDENNFPLFRSQERYIFIQNLLSNSEKIWQEPPF